MSETPGFTEIGEIPPNHMNSINTMRTRASQISDEIGKMEIRKFSLIHESNRLEGQMKSLLESEALRLGVPEGSTWQLTPQGKVLIQAKS